jgi:hypothetical protein
MLNAGALKAWIGEVECSVSSVTSVSATLSSPPLTAKNWLIRANVFGKGDAFSTVYLLANSTIIDAAFTVNNGSLAGGVHASIKGSGFSSVCSENSIVLSITNKTNPEILDVVSVSEYISCSPIKIEYKTPSLLGIVNNHINVNSIKQSTNDVTSHIEFAVTSVSNVLFNVSTSLSNFQVSTLKSFVFSLASTPVVFMNTTKGFAGDVIKAIAFTSYPTLTSDDINIEIGGKTCTSLQVSSQSSTLISHINHHAKSYHLTSTCLVPELKTDVTNSYPLTVDIQPFGYSINTTNSFLVLPSFTSLLKISQLSPYSVNSSLLGGEQVFINGADFLNDLQILICNVACNITSVSYSTVSCSIPPRMTTSGIEEIDLQNLNKDLIDGINGTIYSSLSNQNSILHSFIEDGNISSAFFDTKVSCYVGYVLPTGYVARCCTNY